MPRTLPLALGLTLSASVAAAQAAPPQSYLVGISFFKVKPERSADFVSAVKNAYTPVLDKLKSEGALLAWGLDVAELHHAGEYSHSLWVAIPGLATLDSLNKEMAGRAPGGLWEMVEPGGHHDLVLRSTLSKLGPATSPGTRFLAVKRFRVERGKEAEWRKFFEKYYSPILDPLVADGTIEGHGLLSEEFASMEPGTQWHWTRTTSRAAIGKMMATFAPAIEKMTPAERSIMMGEHRTLIVGGSPHDDIWRSEVFSAADQPSR